MLGLTAARALVRRNFFGKHFLLSLMAVPQALPAIVAVLAILSLYGNAGIFRGYVTVYGLPGIILVHVFFNLPLAMRLCFETIQGITPNAFKLGEQLSFSDRQIFMFIEWPQLRSSLPRIFGLIFLLCAASFVVVLTLGGVGATTLEVAIYQSLRVDFDVARAITLSIMQVCLSLILVISAGKLALHTSSQNFKSNYLRKDGQSILVTTMDYLAIGCAVLIVVPPLMAIVIFGITHVSFDEQLLHAFGFSLVIGSLSAFLSVLLAWGLSQRENFFSNSAAMAGLIVPPAVIATGWFLAFKNFESSIGLTMSLVIALNSLMVLPFSVALLRERFGRRSKSYFRLCAQLSISGWNLFWQIELPLMKRTITQALILAFVLSLGDLTAVTLLGSQGLVTLPALIHQQMGHYRGADAAGTAFILSFLCFGVTYLAQSLRSMND